MKVKKTWIFITILINVLLLASLFGVWVIFDDNNYISKKEVLKKIGSRKEFFVDDDPFLKLSYEDQQFVELKYRLAINYGRMEKFREALKCIKELKMYVPEYKQSRTLEQEIDSGLKRFEDLEEKKRRATIDSEKDKKVKKLLEKAKEAVKKHNISVANVLFKKIKEIDPYNYEVGDLEVELSSWEKDNKQKNRQSTLLLYCELDLLLKSGIKINPKRKKELNKALENVAKNMGYSKKKLKCKK